MSFISDRNNNTTARGIRFIHELPYIERKLLRDALDINNKWEELGGVYMGFDYATLFRIGQAVMRNQSPTDELLSLWSSQNHTILELFKLLWKMEHYQAMRILKPFVEERYHHLIYEGENSTCSQLLQRNVPTAPPEHHFSGSRGRAPSHQNNPQGNFPVAQSSSARRPTCDETRPKTERRVQEMTLEACSPLIPYKELQIATNNWDESRVIGRGGFGVVFKGRWKNTEVAIKRLVPPRSNESVDYFIEMQRQQSMRELKFLNNFQHDNILPLYGYSIGGERPCLVYKYMSNGSLEDRIRCRNNTIPLSWARRVSIGVGTARGLQFLHERDTPLIHGDIKSANILLDANLEPKIGDFGLAREGPVQQYTHVTLVKIHGTRPYLPDEFLRGKKLSIKVDTYSFGVVLCELATGLKAFDDTRKEKYLRDHVHSCDDKNIIKLMDVKGGSDDNTFYLPLISLAKKCSSLLPKDRPKMVDVLETLEALWDQRKIPYVRKPSLPLSSVSHVHPAWMFLSPSPSKQPLHIALSTSPTYQGSQQHPVLPQVPESARYNRTPFETTPGNELNVPQIQVNIPSSPSAQTNETNITHSPDKQSSENRRMTPPIAEQSSVSLSSSEYTSETEASSNELSCNQPAEMPLDTGTAMIPDVSLLNISEE